MRIEHIICDLCKMDGYTKTAVAMYRDAIGDEWDVCLEHLELVKEAGLEEYQMLTLEKPAGVVARGKPEPEEEIEK